MIHYKQYCSGPICGPKCWTRFYGDNIVHLMSPERRKKCEKVIGSLENMKLWVKRSPHCRKVFKPLSSAGLMTWSHPEAVVTWRHLLRKQCKESCSLPPSTHWLSHISSQNVMAGFSLHLIMVFPVTGFYAAEHIHLRNRLHISIPSVIIERIHMCALLRTF